MKYRKNQYLNTTKDDIYNQTQIKKNYYKFHPNFFNKMFIKINKYFSSIVTIYLISMLIISIFSNYYIEKYKIKNNYTYVSNSFFNNIHNNDSKGFIIINTVVSSLLILICVFINYIAIKIRIIKLYFIVNFILLVNYLYVNKDINLMCFNTKHLPLLKIISLLIFLILNLYLLCYLIKIAIYSREFISNNFTFKNIYHQINLRTDMLKFSYNYYVMKIGIHKLLPNIVFSKNSFYYVKYISSINNISLDFSYNSKQILNNKNKTSNLNDIDYNISNEDENTNFITCKNSIIEEKYTDNYKTKSS